MLIICFLFVRFSYFHFSVQCIMSSTEGDDTLVVFANGRSVVRLFREYNTEEVMIQRHSWARSLASLGDQKLMCLLLRTCTVEEYWNRNGVLVIG